MEVALPEDRGPRDTAVVLHCVEVHSPFVARGRRNAVRLGERLPRDEGFDDVAVVPIVLVVECPGGFFLLLIERLESSGE